MHGKKWHIYIYIFNIFKKVCSTEELELVYEHDIFRLDPSAVPDILMQVLTGFFFFFFAFKLCGEMVCHNIFKFL